MHKTISFEEVTAALPRKRREAIEAKGQELLGKIDTATHDAWFRAKVQEALDDPRPAIPHEKVEAHFAARRKVR